MGIYGNCRVIIELRLVDSECFESIANVINVGLANNVQLYHHLKPQHPHSIVITLPPLFLHYLINSIKMTPVFLKKMEPFFTLRNKIPLQIVLVTLIITVITLSGVRLILPNRPPGRSTTMGLGMVSLFSDTRSLRSNMFLPGCQVPHHPGLRDSHRALHPLPSLEQPQGVLYPQCYGSCLLGGCCVHDDPG